MIGTRLPKGEWFTAATLAEADVAGLPTTDRAIRERARVEGWRSRPVKGRRGGGREFHVASLPDEARRDIEQRRAREAKRQAADRPAPEPEIRPLPSGRKLSPAEEARAAARKTLVDAADTFAEESGLGRDKAIATFCQRYNAGELDLPKNVTDTVPSVKPRSLWNWRKKFHDGGFVALAGNYGQNRGSGIVDTDDEIRDFIVGMIAERPHVTASQVMSGMRARFAGAGKTLPGDRTVRNWIRRYREENGPALLALMDPDAYRSRLAPAFGNAGEQVTALNQVWELDSTIADVEEHPGRRPSWVACIDLYSRRTIIRLCDTSSAADIAATLRRAIIEWGVPRAIRIDNGQDYVSIHMQRACADLGIRVIVTAPFSPEQKGYVERVIKTMNHQLLELLPGYVGHSVADRKSIENRRSFSQRMGNPANEDLLSREHLQTLIDQWIEGTYMHEPHGGLGGKTPFQMVAEWTGRVARLESERPLDLLLAPVRGTRVVAKEGIRYDGDVFVAGELGPHVGRRVEIRTDPEDMGWVYVFDAGSGDFICKAFSPTRTGISPKEAAAEAKRRNRRLVAEKRAEMKKLAKSVGARDIAHEIAAHGMAKAGKVQMFPKKGLLHETAALQRAEDALAEPETVSDLSDDDRAAAAALWDDIHGKDKQAPAAVDDGDLPDNVTALPAPPPPPPSAREIAEANFDDDVAFAIWAMQHRHELGTLQRRYLGELLDSPAFRELLRIRTGEEIGPE